jgi:protease II
MPTVIENKWAKGSKVSVFQDERATWVKSIDNISMSIYLSLMQPPHAAKLAHQIEIHGDTIVDDYFWLRDRDNPQVMEYLKAENDYTEQVLQPHAELRESLFQELKARVKEDDLSVPVKKDGYYYYSCDSFNLNRAIGGRLTSLG